ncbi:MAG: DUF3419 family protein [Chlamydiales bacterium]|nr:DUF3419 family protein [Chlamydiales bacterium]
MKDFFSRLSYSFGNEDWNSEYKALKIQKTDRVVCITASGDRPLNLLFPECAQVVSVDINKIQNYLLKLKCAGLQELEYEDYITFLFGGRGAEMDLLRQKVLASLETDVRTFWEKNKKMLEKGIIYQGKLEVWFKRLARLIQMFRGKKIRKLFEMENLEEQKEFVQRHWDTRAWRRFYEVMLNPWFTRFVLKDPALFFNVDSSVNSIGTYLHKRMYQYLMNFPAKNSSVLSLLFKGEVGREAFPPCMLKESALLIKTRLDRLSIHTHNIIDFLEEAPDNSFDCYSLSDVASYINESDFRRLLQAIQRTARKGARFSIRQFMSSQKIPLTLENVFQRDLELEKMLEREDHCCVYQFTIGHINS